MIVTRRQLLQALDKVGATFYSNRVQIEAYEGEEIEVTNIANGRSTTIRGLPPDETDMH